MKQIQIIILSICIMTSAIGCNNQQKIDLLELNLNERIDEIINFDDKNWIGVETIEYPYCLLIEIDSSYQYSFAGIDLRGQKLIFQINSEKLKTDSITKSGGAHFNLQPFDNSQELTEILKEYDAENIIYGFRVEMNTPELQQEILKKLENKYGTGIKNPNTDNGLYWNVESENKYIFYAPDYFSRLVVLNNTNLSKTCYWDAVNGLIDFGGCDEEKYKQELIKNKTKPEDVVKTVIKIGKNWSVNGLVLGKSNEADFVNLGTNNSYEKTFFSENTSVDIVYQNGNDFSLHFASTIADAENPQNNIFKEYFIMDFNYVEISFENGIKPFSKREDIVKILGKNQIENNDASISNYLQIKNDNYNVQLLFNDKGLGKNGDFGGIYVTEKKEK